KKVPAGHLTADVIRQMRNLKDEAVDSSIEKVWGTVRSTPADRLKLIKQWASKLKRPKAQPDVALGRAGFQKTCAQCHTLFGTGGKVGPDTPGANRGSLDYLLENVIDPSAVIPKEYAMTVVRLKSGSIFSGIVREETAKTLNLVLEKEVKTIAVKDIEA